jgi:hypothetical protein
MIGTDRGVVVTSSVVAVLDGLRTDLLGMDLAAGHDEASCTAGALLDRRENLVQMLDVALARLARACVPPRSGGRGDR